MPLKWHPALTWNHKSAQVHAKCVSILFRSKQDLLTSYTFLNLIFCRVGFFLKNDQLAYTQAVCWTPFYQTSNELEHQTDMNVFIYGWSNSNTPFLASNKRTSNIVRPITNTYFFLWRNLLDFSSGLVHSRRRKSKLHSFWCHGPVIKMENSLPLAKPFAT